MTRDKSCACCCFLFLALPITEPQRITKTQLRRTNQRNSWTFRGELGILPAQERDHSESIVWVLVEVVALIADANDLAINVLVAALVPTSFVLLRNGDFGNYEKELGQPPRQRHEPVGDGHECSVHRQATPAEDCHEHSRNGLL